LGPEVGKPMQMRHGDKLFLGRAYALKLFVPLTAADCGKDMGLTLDGCADEIAALEDSPSW